MSQAATVSVAGSGVAGRLQAFLGKSLADFPWEIVIHDWRGHSYSLGERRPHWRGCPLEIELRSEAPGRDLLALNPLRFLDRFVRGEVNLKGNLYLLPTIRDHLRLAAPLWQMIPRVLSNRALAFQTISRAAVNVKSHYDIPQEALNLYLDRAYLSYSCGMFAEPEVLDVGELTRAGRGSSDDFDSLEKAQWRKFDNAAAFVDPRAGESVLDVGCGYGGQLQVLLERSPRVHVVGWTHSQNQTTEGRKRLAGYDASDWELHEGDFREETRVFDHVTSTGMISHVGPRGLEPYVRHVRRLIKRGGRYLHHALMTPYSAGFFDAEIGVAFNKKYVWPGFHWFTLGTHVKALEKNGFEILRLTNLSPHYAKTTAAWYERMMASREKFRDLVGEATLRAWQFYLAGCSGGFRHGAAHVYRLYCRAV